MTTPYSSGRGSFSGTFIAFLFALVLGAAAMVVFVRHATSGILARVASLITGRTTAVFEASVPDVVEKIQRTQPPRDRRLLHRHRCRGQQILGRPSRPPRRGPPPFSSSTANRSQVSTCPSSGFEDVKISDSNESAGVRSIHVTLPASQLFVTNIDNQRTRVFAQNSTGIFVPADQNLESRVTRAKAEQQLQQAALSDGILDTARKNARATVTTLLYGLGFQNVDVT